MTVTVAVGYTDGQFLSDHSLKITLFIFLTAQYFMFLPWKTHALKFQVLFPSPFHFFNINFFTCTIKLPPRLCVVLCCPQATTTQNPTNKRLSLYLENYSGLLFPVLILTRTPFQPQELETVLFPAQTTHGTAWPCWSCCHQWRKKPVPSLSLVHCPHATVWSETLAAPVCVSLA